MPYTNDGETRRFLEQQFAELDRKNKLEKMRNEGQSGGLFNASAGNGGTGVGNGAFGAGGSGSGSGSAGIGGMSSVGSPNFSASGSGSTMGGRVDVGGSGGAWGVRGAGAGMNTGGFSGAGIGGMGSVGSSNFGAGMNPGANVLKIGGSVDGGILGDGKCKNFADILSGLEKQSSYIKADPKYTVWQSLFPNNNEKKVNQNYIPDGFYENKRAEHEKIMQSRIAELQGKIDWKNGELY